MRRNQNFVASVTGHRVRRIDWISTVRKQVQQALGLIASGLVADSPGGQTISGLIALGLVARSAVVSMAKPPKAFATRRPGEASTVGTWGMLAKLANEKI